MGYLGNNLQVAYPTYRLIDDISGSFNGSTKTFALKVSGSAPVPPPLNSQQCLISVAGVIQQPDDTGVKGFKLSGSNIVFSSAPAGGASFFGIILAGADYVNVGANFPSGSAAVPSVTFDASTGTGLYLDSSNVLGFTTGGTKRATIDSNGNFVVVGSGSATAPALAAGSGTTYSPGIYSPGTDQLALATGGSGRLFINSSGNIGAGTSSPSSRLSLDSGATALMSELNSTNANGGYISFLSSSTVYGDIGTAAQCVGGSASDFSINARGARALVLGTNNTNRLHITSGGLVGIGNSSPSYLVDASGSAATGIRYKSTGSYGGIIADNSNTTGGGFFGAYQNGTQKAIFGVVGAFAGSTNSDTGLFAETGQGIQFFTNGAPTTPKAVITSGGSLGIGTTSPSKSLEIAAGGTSGNGVSITGSSSPQLVVTSTGGSVSNSVQADDAAAYLGTTSNHPVVLRTNNTERARIDTSGRLLVGTSTARTTFYNQPGTYGPAFQVESANVSSGGSMASIVAAGSNSFSAYLLLGKHRGSAGGTPTIVNNNDAIGEISFQGGDGSEMVEAGAIRCEVDGTPGSNDMPGRLVFSTTADGASSPTERMRIANNGRLTVANSAIGTVTALTDAATVAVDLSLANYFSLTLGGNRTLGAPTNQTAGQSGVIVITQDATGSRTLAYNSVWKFPSGTAPTLTTTANAVDVLCYYVESGTRITARILNDVK